MKATYTREMRKPKGSITVKAKNCNALAYINPEGVKPYAMTFRGNANTPSAYFSFKNTERRDAYIAEYFDKIAAVEKIMVERKASRTEAPIGLVVGDVLRSSWGYDQTNVDYYEVTAILGKRFVEIREIGQQTNEDGFMQGDCVPTAGKYIGKAMRKAAQNGVVRIASYASAFKVEPTAVIAGKAVYAPSRWTAYA